MHVILSMACLFIQKSPVNRGGKVCPISGENRKSLILDYTNIPSQADLGGPINLRLLYKFYFSLVYTKQLVLYTLGSIYLHQKDKINFRLKMYFGCQFINFIK